MFEPGTFLTLVLAMIGAILWFSGKTRFWFHRTHTIIVWYVIILHWLWGSLLLASSAPLSITAIFTVVRLGLASFREVGVLYLSASLLAWLGLFMSPGIGSLFLLPQFTLLGCSAYGAIRAMVLGTFADGVIRSHTFLMADQAPSVIIFLFYFVSFYNLYLKPLLTCSKNPLCLPSDKSSPSSSSLLPS